MKFIHLLSISSRLLFVSTFICNKSLQVIKCHKFIKIEKEEIDLYVARMSSRDFPLKKASIANKTSYKSTMI